MTDTPPTLTKRAPWPRIFIVVFLLFVCFVALGVYAARSFGGKLYNSLTPAEKSAYKAWVDTPLPVSDEQLKPPPVPDPALTKEKTALFEDFIAADYSVTTLIEPSDSCQGRWDNLTHTQAEQLIDRFRPVMARARSLVSDPHYSYNSRLSPLHSEPPQKHGIYPLTYIQNVCEGYARALAQQKDWDSALDAIDTNLHLIRCDQFVSSSCRNSVTVAAYNTASVAREIAESSYDPEFTSRTLQLLTRYRPFLFEENIDIIHLGEALALVSHMKADKYITDIDLTPAGLLTREHETGDYLHWLISNLPSDDPRLEAVRRSARIYPENSIAARTARIAIGSAFGVVLYGVETHHIVYHWKLIKFESLSAIHNFADYDRVRLALAQRIAYLTNQPIPAEPKDFVPQYLPEYPRYAKTGDPLALSTRNP